MADNIFDVERDRRIQNLQQQSVSNIIKQNPNLRSVLTRYEDAEVSRIKLLELQRLRNKKITKGEIALLKAVSKGRGRRGRRGRSPKKKKSEQSVALQGEPPQKSQTQIEVEAEERRAKIKQEEKRLRQQDRFLQLEDFRQQRQFYANERRLEQRELQRLTDFATGQNRLIADAQIAQFNQAQENFRANQRNQQRIQDREKQARQLEQERLNLQRRQIDANTIQDRDRQETERKKIDSDIEKYNIDARRLEAQRDKDIEVAQRQLQDVQERVAREDARRHAELQQQQELALRNLAAQQKDNERRHREELNKIQNQRAVDAERAITDRELIQGFTSAIETLNRQQQSQQLATNQQISENIREILRIEEPSSSETTTEAETPLSAIEQTGSEIAQEAQEASVREGLRPDPSQTIADIDQSLREVDEAGELALSEASSNLSSSSSDILERATPEVQRAASIHLGRTPTFGVEGDRPAAVAAERGVGRGQGERGTRSPSPESGLLRPNPAPESEGSFSSDPSIIGEYSQNTPLDRAGAGQVETLEEEQTLGGQLIGAAAGAAQATGQVVGGAVAGVAQGIAEQLPTAGQVGAAVGRGGAAVVGGVASAVYQGLRGEPEPGQQTGGRLDPRGEVVGLGQEINEP